VLLRVRDQKRDFEGISDALSSNFEDLEIFYIRRTHQEKDRWSSHVAFPGGRAELGETDQQAVIREYKEEVGLDLESNQYRLD
jgi:8-oxo-dGTP pyrophosphatase MutT (NUDIX family)